MERRNETCRADGICEENYGGPLPDHEDGKPVFDLLDSGQKRRARRLFDSFGEDAFSLEMVVATMDYSSSTASAYLHQFTLLRILECRKKMYQFLVNPKEHPEVFEDVA